MGIDTAKYKCYPRSEHIKIMKPTPRLPQSHEMDKTGHEEQPKMIHRRRKRPIRYRKSTREKYEKIMKTLQALKRKQQSKDASNIKKPLLQKLEKDIDKLEKLEEKRGIKVAENAEMSSK